ncbi:MAG: radical SAM protein [Prevotella sp.]|nr:radical SAM protein [Prevotella sp.]
MAKKYMTREGGATVTVFVPYDCNNNCPFCINKQEYRNREGFSVEKVCESIRMLHEITPKCDFVFTGGEPFANPDGLQVMMDCVPEGHRIFINTTLPVSDLFPEERIIEFTRVNKDKITCINVSRHMIHYVVESNDSLLGRLHVPVRINCVLFDGYPHDGMKDFAERFAKYGRPIQFRADYTVTTLEQNLSSFSAAFSSDFQPFCWRRGRVRWRWPRHAPFLLPPSSSWPQHGLCRALFSPCRVAFSTSPC